jgi:hypothetical protein
MDQMTGISACLHPFFEEIKITALYANGRREIAFFVK